MSPVIKQHFINLLIVAISALMVVGGLVVIFTGQAPARHGYHTFEGIERLMGLLPILMGGLFFWLTVLGWKDSVSAAREDSESD